MKDIPRAFLINNDENGRTLNVVEHIGREPAAYAWEDGFLCTDQEDILYFIPETGERVEKLTPEDGWVIMPGWECQLLIRRAAHIDKQIAEGHGDAD